MEFVSTSMARYINSCSRSHICYGLTRIVQSYTLELMEVTAHSKDGVAMADQFEKIIDCVETEYGCKVIYFTTDADGGSKKGRKVLMQRRPWLWAPDCWAHQSQLVLGDYFKEYDTASYISELATSLIGWLNNHGKVRKLFDKAQGQISLDRTGYVIVLAYLVANLTRWTTHCIAFSRLHDLRDALKLAVLQRREAIIKAQVGAATSSEKRTLQVEAEKHCDIIEDSTFWNGLEVVIGDIEPICYATNINQSDCTRPDQVLLTLVGMFLHFADHPEPMVRDGMMKRLEKRWKECDQSLFLLALILNPFEGVSCFGEQSGMNHFRCNTLLILVSSYRLALST